MRLCCVLRSALRTRARYSLRNTARGSTDPVCLNGGGSLQESAPNVFVAKTLKPAPVGGERGPLGSETLTGEVVLQGADVVGVIAPGVANGSENDCVIDIIVLVHQPVPEAR
jgi:hypothetical protein